MVQKLVLRNKCAVLGNATVGKSAIVNTFQADGTQGFPKNYSMTLQSDLVVKSVNIPDTNGSVELYIYDFAGHEVFNEYIPNLSESTSSFIIVYDVSNMDSFRSVKKWYDMIRKSLPVGRLGKPVTGVLLGNKIDLNSRRVVATQVGEEMAKALGLAYFECSAAQNENVDTPFYYVSQSFYDLYQDSIKHFAKIAETSI